MLIPISSKKYPDTFTQVDEDDFERVSNLRLHLTTARTGSIYVAAWDKNKSYSLAHFILGVGRGVDADHINGDTLDNRKSNLRTVTRTHNMANSSKARTHNGKPTSSKYKGVCWDKTAKRWVASIRNNHKSIYLGKYLLEKDAALAYDRKAIEIWGEHAQPNSTMPERKNTAITSDYKPESGGYFNCLVCGKQFWRKPIEIKLGHNKFCNRGCYDHWQKGRKRGDSFREACRKGQLRRHSKDAN